MMEITAALKMPGEALKTRDHTPDISLRVSGKGRLEAGKEVVTAAHLGSVSDPNSHHCAEQEDQPCGATPEEPELLWCTPALPWLECEMCSPGSFEHLLPKLVVLLWEAVQPLGH